MGTYWLLDRHGAEGPSALVETDGSMRVSNVIRFGPAVTELEAQQELLDDVMGKVAPTLKPMVPSGKLAEPGIEPHPDLQQTGNVGGGKAGRVSGGSHAAATARTAGGPKRTGGRGRG